MALDANLSERDLGADQMGATVRLDHPVHHRDVAETIGLVRPDLRLKAAVESAGLVSDLDAAGRHHRHNFLESCQAPDRGCHPSAWADAASAGFQAHLKFRDSQRQAASAGPEQVVLVAAVDSVADHQVQRSVPQGAVRLETERPAVAKARQAAAMMEAAEPEA